MWQGDAYALWDEEGLAIWRGIGENSFSSALSNRPLCFMEKRSDTPEAIADRAAGSVVGAFIGDALGIGPHWYYDIDEMHRDYGTWINDYTEPKPGRYHEGIPAGDLSQTGLVMRLLARSIAERDGYDEEDFCGRLDEELLPQLNGEARHGPGGYTNHSFRQVWQARVVEKKPWREAGGNADTSEAAERLVILSARYASDPGALARFAAENTRLTQTDSLVGQQSVAFALVLALLIQGEPLDRRISTKLMSLVENGDVPFVAPSSIAAEEGSEETLGFASPDALLLPSWIVMTERDPELRIEPSWKVSIVYGMSCAIQFLLPAAYYLASRFHTEFEPAVLHALNGGGQNMSRACLTGALVGAQIGLSNIPDKLIDGLRQKDEILDLARRISSKT